MKNIKLTILGLSATIALNSYGFGSDPQSTRQMLIAPNCLLEKADENQYKLIAVNKKLSLITTEFDYVKKLAELSGSNKEPCGKFINVTNKWEHSRDITVRQFLANYTAKELDKNILAKAELSELKVKDNEQTHHLVSMVQPKRFWDDLKQLSSFYQRAADTDDGEKAAEWIKSHAEEILTKNNYTDFKVQTIFTSWNLQQPSIVVTLGNSINKPGIVVSGHMDTLPGNKPGADDDGTGSVTVFETLRVLAESKSELTKPVHFIWYSAEEYGLIGSQRVVEEFVNNNIAVENVLHFDMTGYQNNNDPTVYLMTDNVSKNLTTYIGSLFKNYTTAPVKYTRCGYQCSDHASWYNAGIPSAIPTESKFEEMNPYIHSSKDTMDHLSIEHMTDYAKVAVAFVGEQAVK